MPSFTPPLAYGQLLRLLKKITIGRDFGNSVEVLQGIGGADRVVMNPPDAHEQNERVAVAPQAASGN